MSAKPEEVLNLRNNLEDNCFKSKCFNILSLESAIII